MPPEIKKVLLDHFQFVALFGTFVTWLAFKGSSASALRLGRRISLFAFFYFLYSYFKMYTPRLIAKLDIVEADIWFRRNFAMNKGTDWVDGFFWGGSVFLFIGIVAALTAVELTAKKKKS
ncbi:MAG TPA: hypothetical protein PKI81_13905 [bacterium]|nr:hypothetical protein [bacterium]HOC88717.1 hypothetical protein [bacterium]HOZ22456.1 hypothetical protein [bacterium]